MLVKAIIILASIAFTSVIAWRKRVEARARLREIEQGTRCLSCDGKEMQRTGDAIRCAVCGYTTQAAALSANALSAEDIDAMTRPDDRSGF